MAGLAPAPMGESSPSKMDFVPMKRHDPTGAETEFQHKRRLGFTKSCAFFGASLKKTRQKSRKPTVNWFPANFFKYFWEDGFHDLLLIYGGVIIFRQCMEFE